jgi:hypothetical protein
MSVPARCAPVLLPLAAALLIASVTARAVTITVTSNDDTTSREPCNLRNAITAINYGNAVLYAGCRANASGPFGDNDTVVFAASLANSSITLAQGQITNYAPLTIAGSGQTIDAGNTSRILSTIAYLGMKNLTLTHGNSSGNGGALYANQAFVSLDHVTVTASRAANGGGVAIVNGSGTFIDATVNGNLATNAAGMFVSAAHVTLTNSTVSDNAATCAGACGGGIAVVSGSTFALAASTLSRNNVASSGANAAGGLYASDSKIYAVNSTIAANTATGPDAIAGALFESQSSATLTHGVWLTNATLAANTATSASATATTTGGALIGHAGPGQLILANTILSANSASATQVPSLTPDLAGSGSTSADHSLLGAALAAKLAGNGNGFSDAPGLAALGDYGGATQTMALSGNSPAVDAGSNAAAVDTASRPLTADQRGRTRSVGGTVDIGAYEFPGDHLFADRFGG